MSYVRIVNVTFLSREYQVFACASCKLKTFANQIVPMYHNSSGGYKMQKLEYYRQWNGYHHQSSLQYRIKLQ